MEFIEIGTTSIAKSSIVAIEVRNGEARDWTVFAMWVVPETAWMLYLGHVIYSLWGYLIPLYYLAGALASQRRDVVVRTISKNYTARTFRLWTWERGDIDKDAGTFVTELKAKM